MDDKTLKFKNKLDNIHNGKILIVENQKYIKNCIKIKVKCSVCSYEWEVLPMQLTRTKKPTGCPKCAKCVKGTTESFKEMVKNLEGNNYIVKGEYVNSSTPIEMLHSKCEKIYKVRPNDFQQGYRCPYCSHGHKLKTQKEFEDEIKEIDNGSYSVLSEYMGTGKPVLMMHNECGYEWNVIPRNFLSNKTRCPICSNNSIHSIGSEKIIEILDNLNIYYEMEKSFDGLKYKRPLKVDFYLPIYNLVIEYDGDQHFKGYYSNEDLKYTRIRDIIKNEYFKRKKINLLRIDKSNLENIEFIINEIINKRSTTIEKLDIYYIENGEIIYDNKKYKNIS